MKALPWFLAAVGIGAAAYIVMNTPGPEYATGNDDIEGAARKTSQWGSKSRLAGKGTSVLGKLKEGFGEATGDENLANEGAFDQAAGKVKDAAGSVAQVAGQTLHEFNR